MMPSVWHFWIMEAMYLEMCSVIVMTLPWPIGQLGPRNTAIYQQVTSPFLFLSSEDDDQLTEIIREVRNSAGHVSSRQTLRPQILKIAIPAYEWEARSKG